MINSLKTACAYVRVSTDKQEELSPDAQKRLLIDYAKKNNMLITEDYIFVENGISGKKADKRPEFQKMIAMAKSKEHPFDVILVWKFSRFARNQEESIVYKSLLKKNNVDVISISEPLIDGPFGSLIERIIEWMDEYYSIRLSGEVIRGMTEKALRGGYIAPPPFGYIKDKSSDIPIINESEAKFVRQIFSMYDSGFSNVEICRALNSAGVRTRKGNTFEHRTVKYILENPFYCGKVRWNRQDHSTHTIKSKEEWIISQGIHEPLFEESYFNHIQDLLASRAKPIKARSVGTMRTWLSGICKCSSCGSSLVANTSKDNFQCGKYNKGACLTSHNIKRTNLESGIFTTFEDIISGKEALHFKLRTKTSNSNDDTAAIHNQLIKLDSKLVRIKQAYRDGIDTLEEYKENKTLLLKEKEELQKIIDEMENKNPDKLYDEMLKKIRNVYEIISNDSNDDRTRAHALRSVVDHIIYNKADEEVQLFFYLND